MKVIGLNKLTHYELRNALTSDKSQWSNDQTITEISEDSEEIDVS